jgi:hypothetical protein
MFMNTSKNIILNETTQPFTITISNLFSSINIVFTLLELINLMLIVIVI